MSILKKDKKPEYDHTERGELGYDISVCYDNPRYMDITQRIWHYIDGDSYDTTTMHVNKIPVADVKAALIRHELKSKGIKGYEGNYELKLVPKGDTSPNTLDAISLKVYREKIEALTKARIGLSDAERSFGYQSEPAKWAETLVRNLEKQVDEAYKALTGETEGKE
jgi:hypothetical protein